nr:uncharacterized protein LOC117221427 [Megalopta genalis]
MYWPLESTATKSRRVFYNALKAAALLCTIAVFLPLSYAVYVNLLRDDPVNFTKAATMTLACVHVVGQAAVSFFQHDQLQRLIEEMVAYFQNLKPYEKEIYQRYIDDYCPFYAVSSIWNALAAFFVIVGALFTAQPFPMMAEYPFPVDYEPVKSVIYLQHSYVAVQCVSTLSSNMIAALLILFATGRFEILMVDLRAAVTVDRLKRCMEQCQLARKYAEDVIEANLSAHGSLRYRRKCFFCLEQRQPIMVKIQSIFLAGSALIEVYMCAWPADALMEVVSHCRQSERAGDTTILRSKSVAIGSLVINRLNPVDNQSETAAESVYRASWYNQDLKVQKTVLLMLVPQKPIVISLRFVMVALSLNYYCSVGFYSIFSHTHKHTQTLCLERVLLVHCAASCVERGSPYGTVVNEHHVLHQLST